MCRLAMCERQNHPGERWFADYPPAASLFRQIKDFEPDCRLFLNCLNSWLGPDQLIFSPPAIRVFIADREVFKPDDEKYSCFWVDFRYIKKKIIDFQNQCWGSGSVRSVCFWASRIRESQVRIRILSSSIKNSKKNLLWVVTSFGLFIFEK